MVFGLFEKAKQFATKLGLGKHVSQLGGLFHKARKFVTGGLDLLKSAPIKSLVQNISQFAPSVGGYYNDAKKYGGIVSNLMNGGLEKKIDRFIKHPTTIERQPRKEEQQDHGAMFS